MKRILRFLLINIVLLSLVYGETFDQAISQTVLASENGQLKLEKLMPKGHHWVISQTKRVKFDQKTEYVIAGASCDKESGGQGAKLFVIKNNSDGKQQLQWESSWFEASSILSVDLYLIKADAQALLVGKYASGGARGIMNDIDIFIFNKNGQVKLIKRLALGIGNVSSRNGYIEVEGELLEESVVLSFNNGVYAEENKTVIHDIQNWNHPVKNVFSRYLVKLDRVELLNQKTYPIFYIVLAEELSKKSLSRFQTMAVEVAKANSYWDYQMIDSSKSVMVKVQCDRKAKAVKQVEFYKNNNLFLKILF